MGEIKISGAINNSTPEVTNTNSMPETSKMTITNSSNANNGAELETYDLGITSNKGTTTGANLDLTRIATSASNANNGDFVIVKNPSVWDGPLDYAIRDDGSISISRNGTIIGFTDQNGLNLQTMSENPVEPVEEIIIEKTNEEITPEIVEEKQEEIIEEPIQEIVENKEPEVVEESIQEEPQPIQEVLEIPKQEPIEEVESEEIDNPLISNQIEEIIPDTKETIVQEEPIREITPSANTIELPSNVKQSGVTKNYTNYTYFYDRWSKGSKQQSLSRIWDEKGRTNNNGIATIDGRYLVAVAKTFGTVGDSIDIRLEDGTVLPCIIADAKGVDATSKWGHVLNSGGVDVIEWESFHSKDEIIIDEWRGKKVSSITNNNTNYLC